MITLKMTLFMDEPSTMEEVLHEVRDTPPRSILPRISTSNDEGHLDSFIDNAFNE